MESEPQSVFGWTGKIMAIREGLMELRAYQDSKKGRSQDLTSDLPTIKSSPFRSSEKHVTTKPTQPTLFLNVNVQFELELKT